MTDNDFPCPGCAASLPAGTMRCPRCAIRLSGPLAQELWHVDQQLGWLRVRRGELVTVLRGGDATADVTAAGVTVTDFMAAARPLGASPLAPTVVPATSRAATPGMETRTVLLGTGVACLVAAIAAGTALLWHRLGTGGQISLMLLVTAALLGGAVRLRLPATAEALATVGVGAVVVDLVAARTLRLPAAVDLSLRGYVGLGAVAAVMVLAAVVALRPQLRAPSMAAVAATYVALGAAVDPTSLSRLAWLGVAAAVLGALLVLASDRVPACPRAVTSVAAAGGLAGGVTAAVTALCLAASRSPGAWAGVAVAVVAVVASEFVPAMRRVVSSVVVPTVAAAYVTVLALVADVLPVRTAPLAVALPAAGLLITLVATVTALDGWTVRTVRRVTVPVAAAAALALAVAAVALQQRVLAGTDLVAAGVALVAVAAVLVVGAVALRRHAAPAAAMTGGVAAVLGGIAEVAAGSTTRTGTAVVVAAAVSVVGVLSAYVASLAAAPAGRRSVGADIGVAADAVLVVCAAAGMVTVAAAGVDLHLLADIAALLAAASVAVALIVGAGSHVRQVAAYALGSGFAATAVGAVLGAANVTTPEAYVAVPAVAFAILGAVELRRSTDVPSAVLLPALVVAATPSVALALDGDVWRQVGVVLAGAAVVAVGARGRLAVPLYVGVAAVAAVVVRVVAPEFAALPRWVTLGSVGTALLVLGATWERRLADVRRLRADVAPRIAVLR